MPKFFNYFTNKNEEITKDTFVYFVEHERGDGIFSVHAFAAKSAINVLKEEPITKATTIWAMTTDNFIADVMPEFFKNGVLTDKLFSRHEMQDIFYQKPCHSNCVMLGKKDLPDMANTDEIQRYAIDILELGGLHSVKYLQILRKAELEYVIDLSWALILLQQANILTAENENFMIEYPKYATSWSSILISLHKAGQLTAQRLVNMIHRVKLIEYASTRSIYLKLKWMYELAESLQRLQQNNLLTAEHCDILLNDNPLQQAKDLCNALLELHNAGLLTVENRRMILQYGQRNGISRSNFQLKIHLDRYRADEISAMIISLHEIDFYTAENKNTLWQHIVGQLFKKLNKSGDHNDAEFSMLFPNNRSDLYQVFQALKKSGLFTKVNVAILMQHTEKMSNLTEILQVLKKTGLDTQDNCQLILQQLNNGQVVAYIYGVLATLPDDCLNQARLLDLIKYNRYIADLSAAVWSLRQTGLLTANNFDKLLFIVAHNVTYVHDKAAKFGFSWQNINFIKIINFLKESNCLTQQNFDDLCWKPDIISVEMQKLLQSIDDILLHGGFVHSDSSNLDQGAVAICLALALKNELKSFLNNPYAAQQECKEKFIQKFITKLHSQDESMQKHRDTKLWQILVVNILAALFALPILIKLAHSKYTTGHCAFFLQKTDRQLLLEKTEHVINIAMVC